MKVLNFQERIDFVNEVIESCKIEDEYQPALFDIVFRLQAIKYFAGVEYKDIPQEQWPDMAYSDYSMRYNLDGIVYTPQISSLREACKEKVKRMHNEFMTLAIVSKRDAVSDFVDYLTGYLESMKSQFDGVDVQKVMDIANKLNDVDTKEIAAKLVKELHPDDSKKTIEFEENEKKKRGRPKKV